MHPQLLPQGGGGGGNLLLILFSGKSSPENTSRMFEKELLENFPGKTNFKSPYISVQG